MSGGKILMKEFEEELKKGISGWRKDGPKFESNVSVLVQKVKHSDGRRGVLKASAEDTGRISYEYDNLSSAIEAAKLLFKKADMFPAIYKRSEDWKDNPLRFFIMEDCGETLKDVKSVISISQAAYVAIPLLKALQAFHLTVEYSEQMPDIGKTHNDIKPTNILIGSDGKIRLIDFDVASVIHNPGITKKPLSGSYYWAGTDALSGKVPQEKDDLESLGQLLIWLVTRQDGIWKTKNGKGPTDQKWRKELADEKIKWRQMNWPERARYMNLDQRYIKYFEKYYNIVENLGNPTPDTYKELRNIWEKIADKKWGVKSDFLQDGKVSKIRETFSTNIVMSKIPRGEIKRTRPLATAAAMGDVAAVKKLLALRGDKAIPNDEIIEAYTIVEDHGHQGVKTLLAEHAAVRNIYGLVNAPKKGRKKKTVKFLEIEEEYQEPEKMSVFIKNLLKDTPLPKAKKAKAKSTTAAKTSKKRPSPLKNVGDEKISKREIEENKKVFAKLKAAKAAKLRAAKRPSPLKDIGGYKLTEKEKKEVLRLNKLLKKAIKESEEAKPKKNISAFLFYKKKREDEIAESDPSMSAKEVKKTIETSWRSMNLKEKKPYELKAKKDEARYKKETAVYEKGMHSPAF